MVSGYTTPAGDRARLLWDHLDNRFGDDMSGDDDESESMTITSSSDPEASHSCELLLQQHKYNSSQFCAFSRTVEEV